MPDTKNSSTAPLETFMQKKSAEKNEGIDTKYKGLSTTKQKLAEAKKQREQEDKKKLFEAKKESIYKASRYDQSQLTNRRLKQTGLMYVLVIGGAIFLILFVIKFVPLLASGVATFIKNLAKIQ